MPGRYSTASPRAGRLQGRPEGVKIKLASKEARKVELLSVIESDIWKKRCSIATKQIFDWSHYKKGSAERFQGLGQQAARGPR